ncbi:MAG: flagellin domain protein [Chlamydiales bacterium]|jgi:flagellin|nr:flagellin domain protein [Chlamydiales bacterium]
MIIQNNKISGAAYVPYLKSLNNLSDSAARLASGHKSASPSDGTGELGVADQMRRRIQGTQAIVATMENALGYSATQDQVLSNVSDMIARMAELSASAVDTTKVTADRVSLDAEFKSLSNEVTLLATNSKYNGQNLFGTALTIRIGIESTDTASFSAISLGALTFGSMSLINATVASAALSTLKTRAASLASLRNKARSHYGRIERTMDVTQVYLNGLSDAESAIRDVDVAQETSNFMKQQMLMNAGQSVIAQANGLVQSAQRFFQF